MQSTFVKIVVAGALMLAAVSAHAQQAVSGYYRANGTYVQPYMRSTPNGTVQDNYSFHGNTNPYTGQAGSNYYHHDQTSPYFTGPNAYGQVGHSASPFGSSSSLGAPYESTDGQ